MGKWAKPDLSYLENDLFNNSIKSISWQLINIINKKLYKEKLSDPFWENCQKVAKYHDFTFHNLSDLEKIPFERLNKIHLFLAVHQYPLWEASCRNRDKKLFYNFLDNWLHVKNGLNLAVFDKWSLSEKSWRRTDDRWLGIRKAPLPFGWRS